MKLRNLASVTEPPNGRARIPIWVRSQAPIQPGSGTHRTAEVSGVSEHWYARQDHLHSYLHTCPQGHTQMYSEAHARSHCSQEIQQGCVCSRAAVRVPAAFPRLAKPVHSSPPPDNQRKQSGELPLPSTPSSYQPERPGAQLPGACSFTQNPDFRSSPSSAEDSVSQHAAEPEGHPGAARARRRSTAVCRRLGREEVRSQSRPRPSRS